MTTKIRAVEVAQVGAPLKLVDLERVDPDRGQVGIAIEACGVCHSDYDIAQGWFGGDVFPLTPGHEIAGRIDSLATTSRAGTSATESPLAGSAATVVIVPPAEKAI